MSNDEAPAGEQTELAGWFTGRCPQDWFESAPEVRLDREEIVVVGRLAAVPAADPAATAAAEQGRIRQFREDTRDRRMAIAREAQRRFGRKVSWGASCGDTTQLFTNMSVPVMTRLRQPERQVLDTLVEAGVARSRSDALAWSVRLVGRNLDGWLTELRSALEGVQRARAAGPS
jgi:hypothetical protein